MNKTDLKSLSSLSNDELLLRVSQLVNQSRRVESVLVAHLAEVDARRLYAREALPSMFQYCRDVLHLSESEAYLRIEVARMSRRHPMVLTMLEDGRLHLSAIATLALATEETHSGRWRGALGSSRPQEQTRAERARGRAFTQAGCPTLGAESSTESSQHARGNGPENAATRNFGGVQRDPRVR